MRITAQARNYALKYGIHVYGLTGEYSSALVFYDIGRDEKLCTYKSYSGDAPLQKSTNHCMELDPFMMLPQEIRTAQGVQKVVDVLARFGYAYKLDDDELSAARRKIMKRSTGVEVQ